MATFTTTELQFQTIRIFTTTSKSYENVLAKIYASIGTEESLKPFDAIKASITDPATYRAEISKLVGPHGFMFFRDFDHGRWTGVLRKSDGSSSQQRGLRSRRIILGNPLLAVTMLKLDINAGLFLPVEILVREIFDEDPHSVVGNVESSMSTQVSYLLPSSLIAPDEADPTENLRAAVQTVDNRLAKFVEDICS